MPNSSRGGDVLNKVCALATGGTFGRQPSRCRICASRNPASFDISIVCGRVLTITRRQDIAGGSFLFKMQLGTTDVELMKHLLTALFDSRKVGSVAGDKFFDNCPERSGLQQQMGNMHVTTLPRDAKSKVALGQRRQAWLLVVPGQRTRQAAQRTTLAAPVIGAWLTLAAASLSLLAPA